MDPRAARIITENRQSLITAKHTTTTEQSITQQQLQHPSSSKQYTRSTTAYYLTRNAPKLSAIIRAESHFHPVAQVLQYEIKGPLTFSTTSSWRRHPAVFPSAPIHDKRWSCFIRAPRHRISRPGSRDISVGAARGRSHDQEALKRGTHSVYTNTLACRLYGVARAPYYTPTKAVPDRSKAVPVSAGFDGTGSQPGRVPSRRTPRVGVSGGRVMCGSYSRLVSGIV